MDWVEVAAVRPRWPAVLLLNRPGPPRRPWSRWTFSGSEPEDPEPQLRREPAVDGDHLVLPPLGVTVLLVGSTISIPEPPASGAGSRLQGVAQEAEARRLLDP